MKLLLFSGCVEYKYKNAVKVFTKKTSKYRENVLFNLKGVDPAGVDETVNFHGILGLI